MNQQTIYKETRDGEPRSLNEVGKFLASLCNSARDGSLVYPKKSVKVVKGVQKESYTKSSLVRGATEERITQYRNEAQFSSTLQNQDPKQKLLHFAGLNMYGSVIDISLYLAQRLSTDNTHFVTDAGQFGIAAVLCGLMTTQSDMLITETNYNQPGDLRILRAFESYAIANTDEERMRALELLYEDFVVKVFNVARDSIMQIMGELLTSNNYTIGYYNSSDQCRSAVAGRVLQAFSQLQVSAAQLLDNDKICFNVDRKEWMSFKAVHKQKTDTNSISLIELPRIAREKGVLTEVVAVLPPKFRSEDSGMTVYKGLSLRSQDAYKLAYVTGISFKAAKLDASHTEVVEGGKRRTKVLTQSEALTKIIKQFTKYLEAGKEGKQSNIQSLYDRSKYIDITEANISQGTGLQLTSSTAQTVFLYPEVMPDPIATTGSFASNHGSLLKLILSSLGYAASSVAKCPHERVISVVSELYRVFGMNAPTSIVYNNVPKKGSSGNVFSSMMPVPMHYTSQHVQPTQQMQYPSSSVLGEL